MPVTPDAPVVLRPRRGSFDLGLWHELHARRRRGDPQRRRVYAWQREVLGELQQEALLGEEGRRITQQAARAAALAYLTHLWTTYAQEFKPYYPRGAVSAGGICDRTATAATACDVRRVCGAAPACDLLPPGESQAHDLRS